MIFKKILDTFKNPSQLTKQTEQKASYGDFATYWGTQNSLVEQVRTDSRTWVRRYYEMIDHDVLVRSMAMTLQLLMSQIKFTIQCDEEGEEYEEKQEVANRLFMDWGAGDFKQFAKEYVSTFLMGYSLFEIVLKRTGEGYGVDNLSFHPQAYLTAQFDGNELKGFTSTIVDGLVDINRCVYAQGVGNFNHNVYGHSMLRSAYIHYRNKIQVMGSEMYQVKANLEGIPVISLDTEHPDWKTVFTNIVSQLKAIKENRGSGVMLPSNVFKDNDGKPSSVKANDIRLMSVEGSKFIDPDSIIKRENNMLATALMGEFLVMVGQEHGSYSLAKETTSMFKLAVEGMAQHLCDTFQHQVIKPLWVLNGYELDDLPRLTYDSVDISIEAMSKFVDTLAGAGVVLTKSQEDYLFDFAGLPRPTEEERMESMQDTLMMQQPMMQPPDVGEAEPIEPGELEDELDDELSTD